MPEIRRFYLKDILIRCMLGSFHFLHTCNAYNVILVIILKETIFLKEFDYGSELL